MADHNSPENDNQSFVRWHDKTLDERGKIITLFLGMSFATVGFVITQIIKNGFKFKNYTNEIFIGSGTVFLLVSIAFLILLSLNRLKGFRTTTSLARMSHIKQNAAIDILRGQNEKTDKTTYILFTTSLWIFGVSELLIVIGFIIQVWDKF